MAVVPIDAATSIADDCRSKQATATPSAASRRAGASPTPEPAPVTMATDTWVRADVMIEPV